MLHALGALPASGYYCECSYYPAAIIVTAQTHIYSTSLSFHICLYTSTSLLAVSSGESWPFVNPSVSTPASRFNIYTTPSRLISSLSLSLSSSSSFLTISSPCLPVSLSLFSLTSPPIDICYDYIPPPPSTLLPPVSPWNRHCPTRSPSPGIA